jgi:hypothetical protein
MHCAQRRQRDPVITAEGERHCARAHDRADLLLDLRGDALRQREIERHVAVVDHGEPLARVVSPPVGPIPCHDGGRRTDRGGAEARAGTVRRRQVEGHADDGDVDVAQVLAVAPPEEAQRARVRVLLDVAAIRRSREGEIG